MAKRFILGVNQPLKCFVILLKKSLLFLNLGPADQKATTCIPIAAQRCIVGIGDFNGLTMV